MIEIIQHVFVVDNSGLPIYSRCILHTCPLGQLDVFAVSGLLTALKAFAKEIGVGEINSIDVPDSKLIMRNEKQFFCTFQIEAQDNSDRYQSSLLKFSSDLLDVYPITAPVEEESRNNIVTHIERYLAKQNYFQRRSIIDRLRAFLKKLK